MSNITTKLKDKAAVIGLSAMTVFLLAVLGIYAVKHFGTQYTQQKLDDQLTHSGLAHLVHYEAVHFNPFTLTPSIENVTVGAKNAPWLSLARITFNHFVLNYPNLDINFWIKQSAASDLSRDTGRLIRAMGLETLLGKGSFTSTVNGEQISSRFKLNIKDLGIINVDSDVNLLDRNILLSEFRTDLLASLALGQPEAIFIIYGDTLEFRSLNIEFKDAGLINHWQAESSATMSTHALDIRLKNHIQALGLAPKNSPDAEQITNSIIDFLQAPNRLKLSLSPSAPVSLKELALLFGDDNLYKGSTMSLSHQ